MHYRLFIPFFVLYSFAGFSQLPLARDTVMVLENGYVLKMPWANGINFSTVSNIDLNNDGKKDLVLFDRINQFGTGKFRCFIHTGSAGQISYRADLQLSYHFPQCSNWAILRDYNCDGKEDLFCSTSAGIKVFKNTSNQSGLQFTLVKSLLYSDYDPSGGVLKANLYASSVGVPGIADVDNDGDLDILTFAVGGYYIELHKNLSKENHGTCDSLEFEIYDPCWGKVLENNCTVSMNQSCGQMKAIPALLTSSKPYHAGSCLTCLDSDSDGDQDLVMGDISCNFIQYAHNTGTLNNAFFSDTTSLYPNYPNKNNTTVARINNFPCAYYAEADAAGGRDLVVTPNAFGSENTKSVWLYLNASNNGTVNFQFIKNNFLQDEMIEVGQNSYPVLFDYNADGKKDLLIGTYGYYANSSLQGKLTLYENKGTASVPVFSLVTRDYAGLLAQSLNNVMPAVGDIDGDGDIDICIGTSSGQIHWLENTAGQGNTCNFSVFKPNAFTFTTSSAVAAPQLFDVDGDNKLDLVIGTKNGRLAFYKNVGSTTVPSFSLMSNFFGGVDVKGNPNLYGLDGYATPFFYKENNQVKCLVGSVSGFIWQFDVSTNLNSSFTMISSGVNGINEGGQSTAWYEDLDNDGKRDLIVGNGSGGLSYFSSSSPFVGIKENVPQDFNVRYFPNPTAGNIHIEIDNAAALDFKIELFDLSGRLVYTQETKNGSADLDLSHIHKGLYFLSVMSEYGIKITRTLIKE